MAFPLYLDYTFLSGGLFNLVCIDETLIITDLHRTIVLYVYT